MYCTWTLCVEVFPLTVRESNSSLVTLSLNAEQGGVSELASELEVRNALDDDKMLGATWFITFQKHPLRVILCMLGCIHHSQ